MLRKEKDGPDTPAGLRSNDRKHAQRDSEPLPMAPNSKPSTTQHHRSNILESAVSSDGSSNCSSDFESLGSSTSTQTTLSRSETPYSTYNSSVDAPPAGYEDKDLATGTTINLPPCMNNYEICRLLETATPLPPVTPETLKELDLQWIQNHINLRVDVHYDYDLHFMPISGRRGESKRLEAQKFWKALEIEMRIHHHNLLGNCADCSQCSTFSAPFIFYPRLPIMFGKLEELLLILVPNNDHGLVRETLDLDLLMQQVPRGALDVVKLSTWLSDLLTTHCAPIRDEWAHDMTSKISEGVQQNDMASLVAGLEKLFSFCEAMKLDVANHQIRTFRLLLIDDGVSFQHDYFKTRIRLGKLDLAPSLSWFKSIYQDCLSKGQIDSDYSAISWGLVTLATQPRNEIPELFKYDHSRICQLREEISDLVHLTICCDYLTSHMRRRLDPRLLKDLQTRLLDLTDGEGGFEAGANATWDTHLDAISAEVTRAVFASSYNATRKIPAAAFLQTRHDLKRQFQQIDIRLGSLAAKKLHESVLRHTTTFHQLSALQISETQQQNQQQRQSGAQGRHVPDLEDLARRLAHISIIHWRVWSEWYIPVMRN